MPMSSPYSPREWLRLNLQQQGLLQPQGSVAELVGQLGYVQLDSIHVAARAHHHVLHSRLPDYEPTQLDAALSRGELFEYWSHAAAVLPMADYRFSLHRKQQLRQGGKHWFEPDHQVMREVRARIAAEGPLKASDFEHLEARNGAWWDWKPAKKALEQLFMQGELMVLRRDKFHKVYDLTERVLPAGVDCRLPTEEEYARYLIDSFLRAQGFGSAAQMAYLRRGIKPVLSKLLQARCEAGELASFKAHGHAYFHAPALEPLLPVPDKVWLLNPFDNLLIQRQRLKHWFGFDYQIEVYVPEAKRQYGYYCLGILWRDRFVGRVDVKADRGKALLLLQQLTLEEGAFNREPGAGAEWEDFLNALERTLADYARFNGCGRWKLVKSNDREMKRRYARQQSVCR
jgi:uncharacterized protein